MSLSSRVQTTTITPRRMLIRLSLTANVGAKRSFKTGDSRRSIVARVASDPTLLEAIARRVASSLPLP